MKKKIFIILGLLFLIAAIFVGKKFYDLNEMEKMNEEYYNFRETLDAVYFPALHSLNDINEAIEFNVFLSTWFLVNGGSELNEGLLEDLEKARGAVQEFKLENPDTIELREIILENIEIQSEMHELVKRSGPYLDDFDIESEMKDLYFSNLEKLSANMKKMNENLGKYYK